MALLPTHEEVTNQLAESVRVEEEKRADQQAQGKEFINEGQGVIPEDVWQNLPGKKEADNAA